MIIRTRNSLYWSKNKKSLKNLQHLREQQRSSIPRQQTCKSLTPRLTHSLERQRVHLRPQLVATYLRQLSSWQTEHETRPSLKPQAFNRTKLKLSAKHDGALVVQISPWLLEGKQPQQFESLTSNQETSERNSEPWGSKAWWLHRHLASCPQSWKVTFQSKV